MNLKKLSLALSAATIALTGGVVHAQNGLYRSDSLGGSQGPDVAFYDAGGKQYDRNKNPISVYTDQPAMVYVKPATMIMTDITIDSILEHRKLANLNITLVKGTKTNGAGKQECVFHVQQMADSCEYEFSDTTTASKKEKTYVVPVSSQTINAKAALVNDYHAATPTYGKLGFVDGATIPAIAVHQDDKTDHVDLKIQYTPDPSTQNQVKSVDVTATIVNKTTGVLETQSCTINVSSGASSYSCDKPIYFDPHRMGNTEVNISGTATMQDGTKQPVGNASSTIEVATLLAGSYIQSSGKDFVAAKNVHAKTNLSATGSFDDQYSKISLVADSKSIGSVSYILPDRYNSTIVVNQGQSFYKIPLKVSESDVIPSGDISSFYHDEDVTVSGSAYGMALAKVNSHDNTVRLVYGDMWFDYKVFDDYNSTTPTNPVVLNALDTANDIATPIEYSDKHLNENFAIDKGNNVGLITGTTYNDKGQPQIVNAAFSQAVDYQDTAYVVAQQKSGSALQVFKLDNTGSYKNIYTSTTVKAAVTIAYVTPDGKLVVGTDNSTIVVCNNINSATLICHEATIPGTPARVSDIAGSLNDETTLYVSLARAYNVNGQSDQEKANIFELNLDKMTFSPLSAYSKLFTEGEGVMSLAIVNNQDQGFVQ